MEEKRIYSFNKACYILNSAPDVDYRMEIDTKNLCTYFVFEDSEEVAKAIRNFGQEDCICFNFHRYLDIFGEIRKQSIALKDRYLKENN